MTPCDGGFLATSHWLSTKAKCCRIEKNHRPQIGHSVARIGNFFFPAMADSPLMALFNQEVQLSVSRESRHVRTNNLIPTLLLRFNFRQMPGINLKSAAPTNTGGAGGMLNNAVKVSYPCLLFRWNNKAPGCPTLTFSDINQRFTVQVKRKKRLAQQFFVVEGLHRDWKVAWCFLQGFHIIARFWQRFKCK